ncbi:head-tail adaptor protein [Parasedimentitalea psychrophila]|uniref:Head-tail adaptor protein n=2 Tax=Parasedimentitalea psychrophila TaxID=2997337 RepID=A0A9Y2L058_9RHOB|nr:head-tail adaptor protein [Parasedimentitalea psychrophila]WIY25122.1 head-tail adaptor protein [Parasedimentitalea psychrophila]
MRLKVQVLAPSMSDDGLRRKEATAPVGDPIWMDRFDEQVSEKWRSGQVSAGITSRFVVRCGVLASSITPKHRLQCEGVDYEITGIKAGQGRRRTLEITAVAKAGI